MTRAEYESTLREWDNGGPVARVAVNDAHNGRMVRPVVECRAAGSGRVKVLLAWLDSADRTYGGVETFSGQTARAEEWLHQQGVRLDAQGIH